MIMKNLIVIALIGLISGGVHAQDEREKTIQQIIEALDYSRQFKSQIEQANNYSKEEVRQLYQKMKTDSGGTLNPKVEDIVNRYMSKNPMQYNDEIISTWGKLFGKDLSQDDLNKILAFHQSSVGKKFTLASERANNGFAAWFLEQHRIKSESAINEFIKEMRELREAGQ
ncbi:MAG: hypothetical protein Q7U16_11995 [Agitococcus sp.]|nr:hypothetical protein [Agitococcus sp.]